MRVRQLLKSAPPVVWWATVVEVYSAISRLYRDGAIDAGERDGAIARLSILNGNWKEILPEDSLRALATKILDMYALKAADSLQLAAALTWCQERPAHRSFICADKKLSHAAKGTGFRVIEIA
jgi:predicted nucleic acid-binding protein